MTREQYGAAVSVLKPSLSKKWERIEAILISGDNEPIIGGDFNNGKYVAELDARGLLYVRKDNVCQTVIPIENIVCLTVS